MSDDRAWREAVAVEHEVSESMGYSACLDDARLAIAMFCMSVAKAIAGMIAVLGGVDAIVFTGGFGEHDAAARDAICHHLDGLNIRFDEDDNQAAGDRVESTGLSCRRYVLPAREDEQIALHTRDLVAARI